MADRPEDRGPDRSEGHAMLPSGRVQRGVQKPFVARPGIVGCEGSRG